MRCRSGSIEAGFWALRYGEPRDLSRGRSRSSFASQVLPSASVTSARAGIADDVEVGDDVAAIVPDETGPGAARDLHHVEAEEVAPQRPTK